MGIEWDVEPAREPADAATPEAALARASRRSAWRAWVGGLTAFVALALVVATTVDPAYQTLWRVLVMALASFGAAGYLWTATAAVRPSRLLVWFTQVAYCGLYALLELLLSALVPGAAAPARIALVSVTSGLTVLVFNRLTTRLIERDAVERRALERAHTDSLLLEGVLLAARTMQHRLNNTLATTVGYADMLANDASLPAEARGRALVVRESAEEASRQLLAIARDAHSRGRPLRHADARPGALNRRGFGAALAGARGPSERSERGPRESG